MQVSTGPNITYIHLRPVFSLSCSYLFLCRVKWVAVRLSQLSQCSGQTDIVLFLTWFLSELIRLRCRMSWGSWLPIVHAQHSWHVFFVFPCLMPFQHLPRLTESSTSLYSQQGPKLRQMILTWLTGCGIKISGVFLSLYCCYFDIYYDNVFKLQRFVVVMAPSQANKCTTTLLNSFRSQTW